MTSFVRFTAAVAVLVLCSGCATRLYELPPPPPENEKRSVSLIPGEEERKREQDYKDARAALIDLNGLLATKRYEEALEKMSQETRTMLEFVSPDKDAKRPAVETLATGKFVIDGETWQLEPATALIAEDLSQLSDSVEGVVEQESNRRKEIFAAVPDGGYKKIVMLKEGGVWVLHRTKIEVEE